jgi:hypothetical protein
MRQFAKSTCSGVWPFILFSVPLLFIANSSFYGLLLDRPVILPSGKR